ncbi:D-serine ammonia-lyase [Vibrio sp. S4M6]|uniref:D-serine ammonia-lyase n=1 Tax=Vibrio sinus TaxID=2946865 RepID=UPI00202AC211|nr:D-serine ammonia-lyase [Vibrio sinus]MCL9779901.1 D-serine ammonia-lyase [Vibrio sinus]
MPSIDMKALCQRYPLIQDMCELREVTWYNPEMTSMEEGLKHVGLEQDHVTDASQRLKRFAPFFQQAFPETQASKGLVESELVEIESMKSRLEQHYHVTFPGRLLLKKDSHLPISGSIKARGGIYEVLVLAEKLAIEHGLLSQDDDYQLLLSDDFKQFFSRFTIVVGSTGNLGMSIGLIGAKLGFAVTVHMSSDARSWKKNKLRNLGVNVVEHQQDYSVAVDNAREQSMGTENCYFIDDENSQNLFLGYSVAGERIKAQLDDMQIKVDKDHPLFVYLPCGVGGAPGGVTFGLKLAFGDNVHCIFAEPTHSPCMLLGVMTGLHDQISVQDIGLDNKTAADGLAVGRPSGFVGKAMERLISGYYTVSDERLFQLLKLLAESEGICLEPSALAGMLGPIELVTNDQYLTRQNLSSTQLNNATHIVWATGGGLVPENEMKQFLAQGHI